jgi:two-component system NarL family sensor kinase
VSALDRRKGVDSPKSPRKVAIFPLRRASDHQPNLVASLDERLRSVTSRMLSAHEAERKRIASELHDCLGQSLSLLRYEIEALLASSSEPEESHEAAIVRLHNYSRRALEELRSIVSDLRPTIIDDRGLIGALEALCEDFRVMSGHIEIRCDVSGDSRRIDDRLAIAVYRIAQEALNNVLRHADAGHSSLVFTMNEESVTLIVTDDGRGLPHGQALRTGLGLFTMRERAESLGGSFEIETRAGEGCRIRARWPIE